MKAKTLGRNLQANLNFIKGSVQVRRWRMMHRTHLPNDEVRYLSEAGSMMFVQDGEYSQINFKPGYKGHHGFVGR